MVKLRICEDPSYHMLRDGSIDEFNQHRARGVECDLRGCDLSGLDLRNLNADGLDDIIAGFVPHGEAPGGIGVWLTSQVDVDMSFDDSSGMLASISQTISSSASNASMHHDPPSPSKLTLPCSAGWPPCSSRPSMPGAVWISFTQIWWS